MPGSFARRKRDNLVELTAGIRFSAARDTVGFRPTALARWSQGKPKGR
jgi:hypothetical protein